MTAYYYSDWSLKLQGLIGNVALQGLTGLYSDRIVQWPCCFQTFDRVFRNQKQSNYL
jgi:hypothetical protein